jgi:transketolase
MTTSEQKSSPATKRVCTPEIKEAGTLPAIETASPVGWKRYIGLEGTLIGIRRFGASVSYKVLAEEFGKCGSTRPQTARSVSEKSNLQPRINNLQTILSL